MFGGLSGRRQQAAPATFFVVPEVDSKEVYVGEPVVAEWTLFGTAQPNGIANLKAAETDGFWTEDLPHPERSLQLRRRQYQGKTYLAASIARSVLFPLQSADADADSSGEPGTLTIGQMSMDVTQADFFGRTTGRATAMSPPVEIRVKPLPVAGRPRGFSEAAVGEYILSAKVDRTQLVAGDAVTLTLTVTGEGNIQKVPLPRMPDLPGFKTYEPKISTAKNDTLPFGGLKKMEILLLPQNPGVQEIPGFTLPTFSPKQGKYVVLNTPPISLKVDGVAVASTSTVTTANALDGQSRRRLRAKSRARQARRRY